MAGGINVKFGATDAGFTSTVSKVKSSVNGLDNNVRKVSSNVKTSFASMAKAGAALAVGFTAIRGAIRMVAGTVDNFKAALDLGGELKDLKERTGESAGNLLILKRAFDNAGAGADKVGPSINKLQKFMVEAASGAEANADVLNTLGVSMGDLAGKAPIDQMRVIAEKINNIGDPSMRAALAMKIFGKSGGELLPVLANFSSEIATAQNQLGGMPGVMDRASETFDNISDNMNVIKDKATELAAGFLEKLSPALEDFTNKLTGIDAAKWGSVLADQIIAISDMLIGAFKSPSTAIKGLGFELMAIGADFMNSMVQTWGYISGLGSRAFSIISNEGFDMLVNSFKFAWESFSLLGQKALLEVQSSNAMNSFAAVLNTIFDGVMWKGGGFDFDKTFAKYKNAGVEANAEISKSLDQSIVNAANSYEDGFGTSTESIKDKWEEIKGYTGGVKEDIFGAGESSEMAADIWNGIKDTGKKLREDFLNGVQAPAAAAEQHLKNGAVAIEKSATKLALSAEILKKINEAEGKDKVDPGGRLEERANEQIAKGRFRSATRTAGKIARNEQEEEIRSAFGGDGDQKEGGRAFGQSIKDLAKEQGIDTFRKSSKQLREELAERARKRGGEMDARKQGKPGAEGGEQGKGKEDPMMTIKNAVETIRDLVKKIEPKLPTAALAN